MSFCSSQKLHLAPLHIEQINWQFLFNKVLQLLQTIIQPRQYFLVFSQNLQGQGHKSLSFLGLLQELQKEN